MFRFSSAASPSAILKALFCSHFVSTVNRLSSCEVTEGPHNVWMISVTSHDGWTWSMWWWWWGGGWSLASTQKVVYDGGSSNDGKMCGGTGKTRFRSLPHFVVFVWCRFCSAAGSSCLVNEWHDSILKSSSSESATEHSRTENTWSRWTEQSTFSN